MIHKIRLTKMFHKKDTKNETHKNITQKLFTKLDSEKCSTKRIHKMRLTKIFHKNDSQKKQTHKNVPQKEYTK